MSKGEAKGHNLQIDDKSLDQFLKLATSHKDGVKVRFGADHDAGADDINGILKSFNKSGDRVLADLHLLKSDKNYDKLIEMAEKLPNEFGLSASTSADEELIGHDRFVRFNEIFCVDIVSNPAATSGLFFSQTTKQTNMKNIALALGLPEAATEAEIIEAGKLALAAKTKMDADAEATKKLEAEAEAKKKLDDEEKGKDSKKGFEAEINAKLVELSSKIASFESRAKEASDSAHKAEIENLKLEAAKDGKVIPLSDEALVKLSIPEVKDVISKLPKNQVKLSRGFVPTADNKPLDKRSAEFKAQLAAKKAEGALLLGQKMVKN